MGTGKPVALPHWGGRLALSLSEVPVMPPKKPKLHKDWESKPVAFQVRATAEYKAVIERFAESEGKSVAALVDHALRFYARSVGFEPIPMR